MARTKRPGNRPTIRRMLVTTPARVASPTAPSAVDEPIPDESLTWEPLDLPRAIRSRRTYRIPVILISLGLAAGAYFAAQFALRLPVAHADGRRADYALVLQSSFDAMPDLQDAAALITDQASGDGYGAHLATLVRLEGLAADLRAVADQQAPLMVPGLPSQDLEMLEPIRDRIDAIADTMTSIGGVLTDAAVYRRTLDDMFLLPELPLPSEGPSVEVFSDRLAQMMAATVEAGALLPDGELFAGHRSQVQVLIEWLPGWQAAYVEALRDDDLGGAEALRDEATGRIAQIRTNLGDPLETAAAWTSDAIARLTLDIQAALVLAG